MSKENEENIDTSLNGSWRSFRNRTTCHGMNKISFTRGRKWKNIRSFLWLSVLCGSLTGLLSLFIEQTRDFYKYPTFTRTTIRYLDEIDFPAVTICNLSPRNKSRLPDSARNEFWRDVLFRVNWSDPKYQDELYYTPRSKEGIINESMSAEGMFSYIMFNGKFEDVSELTPLFARFGLCYTWNKNGSARTRMVGSVLNLHISMNLNIQHYSWAFDVSTGIRMAIHDPKLVPDVHKQGFVIQNGVEAYINVSPKKYIYPPKPFKVYGDEYCIDKKSLTEGDGPMYDREICIDRCFSERIHAVCGCKDVSEPGDAPNCSLYQLSTCYYKTLLSLMSNTSMKCHCPRPCEYRDYDQVISYGQYLSEPVKELLLKENFSTQYDVQHRNYLRLRVYLEDLAITEIKIVPKYETYSDILSNVGGQLGLFLGASIMTVLEFGEFLMQLVKYAFKKVFGSETPSNKVYRNNEH